jgi:hypothetical protein
MDWETAKTEERLRRKAARMKTLPMPCMGSSGVTALGCVSFLVGIKPALFQSF